MENEKNILDLSDEDLVLKSIENVDYFEYLYERYSSKLIRYILRISSFSVEEAEEILQEAFIKVWKNINSFDDDSKFSTWVYAIVHNETLSHFRKSKSFGKDMRANMDYEVFLTLPSSLDIKEDVVKKIEGDKIHQLLLELDEKYREVLVLKFIEDKSYDEISTILQKPEGTVATLINRAKKSFKEIYSKHNEQVL